ncbi:MAG: apiosidase-like domain-containing protein, partial [Phycisphaerae bacterium]
RFNAVNHYDKPWSQVNLSADFAGPRGQTFHVHGFWDGDTTWAIRFSPTMPGAWSYRVTCDVDDAGLKDHAGVFNVLPATHANPLYRHGGFLRVSPDHHYLTYSDGTPFFWLGDTWWFCPSSLVPFNHSDHAGIPSMYKALVNKRQSQGFTIAQMAFMGSLGAHQDIGSFMSLLDGGTFDMTYWRKVDNYINYANNAGIVPAIALGFHMLASPHAVETTAKWKFLWRYFVARYGAYAVTWLITGEYNIPHANVAQVLGLGAYIKKCDPYKRAMTVYPWWYGGDKHQAWSQPWYDFIMLQGAHQNSPGTVPPTYIYTQGWNYGKPVIEGEARYEFIRSFKTSDTRRAAWHAIQAGCCGYTYGANGLWYPTQGPSDHLFWKSWGKSKPWWVAMNYPGAQQMAYMKKFYDSIAWWKTQPRPGAVEMAIPLSDSLTPLARSELQGHRPSFPFLGDSFQPLARSDADEALYVIWFPEGSDAKAAATLILMNNQRQFHYHAQWFNPRTGKHEFLVQTLLVTYGICSLPKRPDDYDWVLLLRQTNSAPRKYVTVHGLKKAK